MSVLQLVALLCLAMGVKHLVGEGNPSFRDQYIQVVLVVMVVIQVGRWLFLSVMAPSMREAGPFEWTWVEIEWMR